MPKQVRWIEKFITIAEFNKELELVKSTREICVQDAHKLWKYGAWQGFKRFAYIWDSGRGTVHLAYRQGGKNYNFATKLDGTDGLKANEEIASGGLSYRIMQKYNKIPKVHPELHKKLPPVKAILYFNPKHNNELIEHAWSYDMNSAYCHILMHYDFPDIEHPLEPGRVEEGQIGFNADFTVLLHVGQLAVNRYNLIESPYKRFGETRFAKIKELRAQGHKAEAKKYKSMLTNGVGYLVYARPIDRNYIILCTNEIIQAYINKYGNHILHANTDSLTSDIPLDIETGCECGQFKLEHEDKQFKYSGVNYWWENEIPKVRGKSKGFWQEGDTLDNVNDLRDFKYKLDWRVLEIVETKAYRQAVEANNA